MQEGYAGSTYQFFVVCHVVWICRQWCSTDDDDVLDRFYATVRDLLDRFYPERIIVIISADSEFVTPAVKAMLRRKNRLMRRGRTDEADVLAGRIGRAIISYNSV